MKKTFPILREELVVKLEKITPVEVISGLKY